MHAHEQDGEGVERCYPPLLESGQHHGVRMVSVPAQDPGDDGELDQVEDHEDQDDHAAPAHGAGSVGLGLALGDLVLVAAVLDGFGRQRRS